MKYEVDNSTTDVSTPNEFNNDENSVTNAVAKQQDVEVVTMNKCFNERLELAKLHLLRIEQKKRIIDKRQVY